MKILKIDDGIAYYTTDKTNYKSVLDLDKEDLYKILGLVLDLKDLKMDIEDEEDFKINHEAEQVIYNDLSQKLLNFFHKRDDLIKEVNSTFSGISEKYKDDLNIED